MTTNNGFDSLHSHAQRLKGASIPSLLAAEPGRVQELALRVGPLYVNFARQKYDAAALQALRAAGPHRLWFQSYRCTMLLAGEPHSTRCYQQRRRNATL